MNGYRVIPVVGIPEIRAGDDLAGALVSAAEPPGLEDDDVIVVAHKVVSKSEGRVIEGVARSDAVASESARILRRSGDLVISETHHGFVCANAGVDASNVPSGTLCLLPLDPDLSARRLRARLMQLIGVDVAVIVSDTFGRPWRLGQTNVAIGVAGMEAFVDYRGQRDGHGNELVATVICIADELAGAAEIVMGKSTGVCAAVVRGAPRVQGSGAAADIVRPSGEDLFR